MDIELTYRDDGQFLIDCGDVHRALALWLEQSWSETSFQEQLNKAMQPEYLPMSISGPEFFAYIDEQEILVFANNGSGEVDIDEAIYEIQDASAACGYDDFVHLVKYIISA